MLAARFFFVDFSICTIVGLLKDFSQMKRLVDEANREQKSTRKSPVKRGFLYVKCLFFNHLTYSYVDTRACKHQTAKVFGETMKRISR